MRILTSRKPDVALPGSALARAVLLLFVAGGAIWVGGCVEDSPTVAAAAKVLEGRYGEYAHVAECEETNAVRSSPAGMATYDMEFRAMLEWVRPAIVYGAAGRVVHIEPERPAWDLFGLGRVVRAGQREALTGTISFQRTKFGWRSADGEVH